MKVSFIAQFYTSMSLIQLVNDQIKLVIYGILIFEIVISGYEGNVINKKNSGIAWYVSLK